MVLIPKIWKNMPLIRGAFFAFSVLLIIAVLFISGCRGGNDASQQGNSAQTDNKEGEFVLLGHRMTVLEKSLEFVASSEDFKTGVSDTFNMMNINGETYPVELEIENAYSCIYPDARMVVFYPVADIVVPDENETKPLGFIHYFNDTTMNTVFQVTVTYDPDYEEPPQPDVPPTSNYRIFFQTPNGDKYGIPRSRILDKREISDEEAFKKFDTSSRTVLIGTNSLDQNKFLFIFLKIPEWDEKVFQIFFRWY